MSTSKRTSFLSEILERKPIPPSKLAYFQARLRHNLYDFVLGKFAEMEKAEGLTKAELARRIGCEPALVTRRLGAPGNWTLDTISDLLIGIAGEELEPQSRSVLGRARRNYDGPDWLKPTAAHESQEKVKGPRSAIMAREVDDQYLKPSASAATAQTIQTRVRGKLPATGPSQSIIHTMAQP